MNGEGKSTLGLVLLAALVCTLLASYVGGYFWLGEVRDLGVPASVGRPTVFRIFDADWEARLFAPAAKVERLLTGRVVRLGVKG